MTLGTATPLASITSAEYWTDSPATTVAFAGFTSMRRGTTCTRSVPFTPLELAVTSDQPNARAVMTPLLSTERTFLSETLQVNAAEEIALPEASYAAALSCAELASSIWDEGAFRKTADGRCCPSVAKENTTPSAIARSTWCRPPGLHSSAERASSGLRPRL